MIRRDLASGTLVRVLAEHERSENGVIAALYPSREHLSPRVQVFLEALCGLNFETAPQS